MARQLTVGKLAEISVDQWGLVTRQQARKSGVAAATLGRMITSGALERVAQGVYLMAGSPRPDHLELCAAYLQLNPSVPVWERTPGSGVVSHRSAAVLYNLGHLPADVHEFTFARRRQSRRNDVRIHFRRLDQSEWIMLRGLLVTRPSRIAADLLRDNEDPEAVAQITVESLREVKDYVGAFVKELSPLATRTGMARGDGRVVLRWLLELGGDPEIASRVLRDLDESVARA